MKKNYWLINQCNLIRKSDGWQIVTLVLFVIGSVLLFLFPPQWIDLQITAKKEILDYIVRFMIFEVPATITIFSFVYKEQKEASYSNTKISNIWKLFYWTIFCSLVTLIFSFITISENPLTANKNALDIIINKQNFIITISYSIASLILLVFFIIRLIRNMDIRHSFSETFKRSKKYHGIIKNIYEQKNKRNLFNSNHIMNKYNHLIESNFQLIISSMEKNNLLEIRKELQEVFSLSQDYYNHFINVGSLSNLTSFITLTKKNTVFGRRKKMTNNKNRDNVVEIYNNILLNYKLLIRKSSDLGITKIQKQAFTEFISLDPVKFYNFNLTELNQEDFENILEYYEELTNCYHRSLFEIIKEFSNEDTMQYSYLLEQISQSSKFFDDVTSIEKDSDLRGKTLNLSLINKVLSLLEAIIISPIGTNNVKLLTESTNILLKFYYTQVPMPNSESNELKKRLRNGKQEDFLDQFIIKNKDLANAQDISDHYFKEVIIKEIIKIIIHALHKSIELGHYQCTGYLTKISCSHLTAKNFYESINDYTNRILDRQNISHDLTYYHYSINNFSKFHCIQKMVLLLNYQMLYRFKSTNSELMEILGKTTHNVFLNFEDFQYMLEKVSAASKSYGMAAFENIEKKRLEEVFNLGVGMNEGIMTL